MNVLEQNVAEFLKMKYYALFGASDKRDHLAFKLMRRLSKRGFRVYPVNPRIAKIGNARCYGTLDELPAVPQVIVLAVSPMATLEVIRSGVSHGVRRFWIQPGSESDDVLTYVSENGVAAVHSRCLYQELGRSS